MTLRWPRQALFCCAVLLGLSGMHSDGRAAEPLRIATSELPPFSMEQRGDKPGALYEMVEELSRRTKTASTIEFVPWRRAMLLTATRPRSAVFPLTRSPEREAQYRWLAPLYRETFLFISLKDGNFDPAAPESYKTRRIGILRGSLMVKYLHERGYPNIVEAASVEESLRFLRRGIVDAVCGDREIFRASLGGQIPAHFATSAPVRETSTWLGGSLDLSTADAARYELAMKNMIDDGSYARILKKYRLD